MNHLIQIGTSEQFVNIANKQITCHCHFYSLLELKIHFYRVGFKGIVHPKMKILSLITQPHVIPNP